MALAMAIGASPSSQQQTADAATQIGLCRHPGLTAGDGAHQGLAGHLDQILPLHQREQAPGQGRPTQEGAWPDP